MRRLTIIALLILSAGYLNTAKAEAVSAGRARQIASGLLGGGTKVSALKEIKVDNLDKDNPEFYVFGSSDGNGFVIVSGDDSTLPVLAYSDKFSFVEGELPSNVAYWMEYMQRKVQFARKHPQIKTKATEVPSISATTFTPIKKLTTALWDQGAPYYNNTPTVTYNSNTVNCVTGCGQTAMAIRLKYSNWPDNGVGSTESYSFSYNGSNSVDTVDLSTHTYSWSSMLDDYSSSYTEEQASAVALLMADLGKAQKASYGPTSTGSNPSTIGSVLASHFKYTNSLRVDRDNYSTDEWCSKLKAELDANRPLIYSGWDTSGAGHSFIVDGYAKYNFFSINWGWSGHYNGYFAIDIFQSEGQGIGGNDGSAYSENQMTFTGLEPYQEEGAAPALDTALVMLLDDELIVVDGSSRKVELSSIGRITKSTMFAMNFINRGPAVTPTLQAGLRIRNHDGSLAASNSLSSSQFTLGVNNYLNQYFGFTLAEMGYGDSDIKFGASIVPALWNVSNSRYYDVSGEDQVALPTINAAYIDCAESYSAGQTFDKTISYGWTKPQKVTWTLDGALSEGDIVLTSGHHTITATLEYALPKYSEVLEIEIDVE